MDAQSLLNLSVTELIGQRTSRRTYKPVPLTDTDRLTAERLIGEIKAGPLGTPVRFSLISPNSPTEGKQRLGTYGFIQGARHFVAGQILPSKAGFLDYGFMLEHLILEFTRLGLGTCWLGGTFDRSAFAAAINLCEGHVIPAITPIGYATAVRGLGDRMIRLGAGSATRLAADKLFFNGTTDAPLALTDTHPDRLLLEAVRLGPSASNNQPWRIVSADRGYRFWLSRKPLYQKALLPVDMQMIDMGIAMAHFDLAARETGRVPEWKISTDPEPFRDWEYVISVFLPG